MTADVTFVTDESKECVYVSRKAIVEENGKTYIYKKSGDNYILSLVETGFTNGAYTEIVSGLEEGESYYIATVSVAETSEETNETEANTEDATMPTDMMQQNGGDMMQQQQQQQPSGGGMGGGMNMMQGGGQR
jgi:hypothetical protein